MFRCMKFLTAVTLIGLVGLGANRALSFTDVDEHVKARVSAWLAKERTANSLEEELAGVKERLRQVVSDQKELEAAAEQSDREASRLAEILAKSKGDVVVVKENGEATEYARQDIQFDQAVCVIAGASAKMEHAQLGEQAAKYREEERRLKMQARREAAKSVRTMLEHMPHADGAPIVASR